MPRVLTDYQKATVTTSLKTSTADLSLATFPKIVLCNKYQLRLAASRISEGEHIFRQSLLEAVGMCTENASLTEMSFAINKVMLSGFDVEVLYVSEAIYYNLETCLQSTFQYKPPGSCGSAS